ncbi:MAG TPA: site-specific integrase [Blastocatellia bacterium]|nr:site-specific integrase [Blastocatellia bacterium]
MSRRTGQIIERGDRKFMVRVFLGRDTATGKRRYHNKLVHGTKKDAQSYLNGVLRDIDLGAFVGPSKMSVESFLKDWMEKVVRARVEETTYRSYTHVVDKWLIPEVGNLSLARLRGPELQNMVHSFQKKGLGARSIQYAMAVLKSALQQAVRWNLIQRNPSDLIDLPRLEGRGVRVLTPEQARNLLKAAEEHPMGAMIQFALLTGTRPGEYSALRWDDFDLDAGTVTIQRTIWFGKKAEGWFLKEEPKTKKSRRSITLPPVLVRALQKHKRAQAEERLKAGRGYKNHGFVFADGAGEPFHERVSTKHLREVLESAGLPRFTRYQLRHSHATILMLLGEHIKAVSERLGHSTTRMTLDVYSHVVPELQQRTAERLENAFSEGVGTP